MLGRFSADAAWTSRSHRAKAGASLATESGRNFSATKRCSRNSSALYHAHPASAKVAVVDAVGPAECATRSRIDRWTRHGARIETLAPGLVQIGHPFITLYWSARNGRRRSLLDSASTLPALAPVARCAVS